MVIDLELLNTHLLAALYRSGHRYFVRQTLPGEYTQFDAHVKACFLVTHYNDMKQVNIHLKNIEKDAHKYVYDLEVESDKQKLYEAALQPGGYKIYTPLKLKDVDQMLSYKSKLKNYIDSKLQWKPKKADDIRAVLSYAFGIFYIEFSWNSIKAKVKADEVAVVVLIVLFNIL
ncbi:MAG: hypothetical protein V4717_11095 [Bacteroidota bacterium]